MRTLGHRTPLLLAIAAAAGLIASLGLPWYGPGPKGQTSADFTARIEAGAGLLARLVGEREGVSGWDALGRVPSLALCGLAGAIVVLLALSLVPAAARALHGLARLAALGAAGVLVWRLVDAPAAVNGLEPRVGVAAGVIAGVVLLAGVSGSAAAAHMRREPVRVYTPPPPPTYDTTASYGPPQF